MVTGNDKLSAFAREFRREIERPLLPDGLNDDIAKSPIRQATHLSMIFW
jgi:hypothetical protein